MKNILRLIGIGIALLLSTSLKAQEGLAINSLAIRPDGAAIAVTVKSDEMCSEDDEHLVTLLTYPGLEFLSTIDVGAECYIKTVEWSRDGRYLVMTEERGKGFVWDADLEKLVSSSASFGRGSRYKDHFSPDGTLITNTSEYGGVVLWDAGTGAVIRTLFAGKNSVGSDWSPDGKYIVTSTHLEGVRTCPIVETQNFTQVGSLACDSWVVHWSPDGQFITTVVPQSISVWDAFTYELLYKWDKASLVYDWEWLPDGHHAAVGLDEGIVIWDVQTGEKILTYQTDMPLSKFDISPVDGSIIYVRVDETTEDPLSNLQIIPASLLSIAVPVPTPAK